MSNQQLTAVLPADEGIDLCQHHWVIQDGDGPLSQGICRLCGQYKDFKNYLEASHWGDDKFRTESRATLLGRPALARLARDEEDEF